jgi:AcrR family transcriptional regulator
MKTSQLILDKATLLIEDQGIAALSMRHLADRLQLTPMALYRHFANKDALLDAVADRYFTELGVRWKTHAASSDYQTALLYIGKDLIDFYLQHPYIYQLMFLDIRPNARVVSNATDSAESPTFSLVVQAVQKGIVNGELVDTDAQNIALVLAGQLHGLVALRQGGRITMSDGAFQEFCHQAFIHVIAAYQRDPEPVKKT